VITTEIIKNLKPCKERFENFLTHYEDETFSYQDFISLKKITFGDKLWVLVRCMTLENAVLFAQEAAHCAKSADQDQDDDRYAKSADQDPYAEYADQDPYRVASRLADCAHIAARCAAYDAARCAHDAARYTQDAQYVQCAHDTARYSQDAAKCVSEVVGRDFILNLTFKYLK